MDGIDFWFSFSGWNWRRKGLGLELVLEALRWDARHEAPLRI